MPAGCQRLEPLNEGIQWFSLQEEESDPGIDHRSLIIDESGVQQNAQVLAHCCRAHPDEAGELPCSPCTCGESFKGSSTNRIGKRTNAVLDHLVIFHIRSIFPSRNTFAIFRTHIYFE